EFLLLGELALGAPEMRVRKPANLQDVLRALGQLLLDADVLLEDRCRIELGFVAVADLDITSLSKRSDDLGSDGVDLPWIQSHLRGTVGAKCLPRKANGPS